jgi:dolichol-phosphate mannosyltransferase
MLSEVSLVIPLYNEEKVFRLLTERLERLLAALPYPVEVVLIDDGSKDATPLLMREVAMQNPCFKAVFLSRNFGHQLAVSAGMAHVSASQAVMILDGDLQDPPELINHFYEKIQEGYEVVYAIRKKRKENVIKRTAYWAFYRILNSISNIDIPLDSGDFCMISRRVNDLMVAMPERSRFLRGMRTWLGFRQIGLPYERDARQAGEAKYNFKMLFRLAYDGIYNFSEVPLRLITKLGLFAISLSLLYLLIVIILKISGADIPPGFTTLIVAISLFSGVQLVSLGIIGEYVSRIYMQVKGRPSFIVREVIANQVAEPVYGQTVL